MKVRVLLFAGLREKMGLGELALDLPLGCVVADFQKKLGIEQNTWKSLAFAVNQTYVSSETELKEGDELALIPPVAGG